MSTRSAPQETSIAFSFASGPGLADAFHIAISEARAKLYATSLELTVNRPTADRIAKQYGCVTHIWGLPINVDDDQEADAVLRRGADPTPAHT